MRPDNSDLFTFIFFEVLDENGSVSDGEVKFLIFAVDSSDYLVVDGLEVLDLTDIEVEASDISGDGTKNNFLLIYLDCCQRLAYSYFD